MAVKSQNVAINEMLLKLLKINVPMHRFRVLDYVLPVFSVPFKDASFAYDYVTVNGTGTFTFSNIVVPDNEQWYLDRIIVENASPANGSFDEVRLRVPPSEIIAKQVPPSDMIFDLYNSSGVDYWSSNFAPGLGMVRGCYIDFVADTHSSNFVVSLMIAFRRFGGAIH